MASSISASPAARDIALNADSKKNLEVLLKQTLSTLNGIDDLISQVDLAQNFPHTVETFLAATTVLNAEQHKLQWMTDIYVLAYGDVSLLTTILQQQGISSVRDVALKFYPQLKASQNLEFKFALFQAEPTAVLLGLLQGGKIKTPAEVKQEDVSQALNMALTKHNFNILTTSIISELSDPEVLTLSDETAKAQIQTFLKAVQRLVLTTRYPEDVSTLLDAGFTSAHMIAHTPLPTLTRILSSHGGTLGPVNLIYAQATAAELRSELKWTQSADQLAAVSFAPVIPGGQAQQGDKPGLVPSLPIVQKNATNWADLVHKMSAMEAVSKAQRTASDQTLLPAPAAAGEVLVDADNITCPDCASVTSPAAYLVDLLYMLKKCPAEPTASKGSSETLFSRLHARRPDLIDIQLSCDNTNIEIPCIDLANEIMESFIRYMNDPKLDVSVVAYNEQLGGTSQSNSAGPQNIDLFVYQTYLCQQAIPMKIFPYVFSIDCARSFLGSLGSSRAEFMRVFQARRAVSLSPLQDILDTAIDAEHLGLVQIDFIAVTKRAFCSLAQMRTFRPSSTLTSQDYEKAIGLRTPAHYWGYSPDLLSTMPTDSQSLSMKNAMLDRTEGIGLSFIVQQLLPRAGVTFDELVSTLESPLFRGSLMIDPLEQSSDGISKPTATSKLEGFRLARMDGSALTVDDCDKLGAVFRLRQKLCWSIEEVAETITILGPGPDAESGAFVGAATIGNMAAISRLSKLTGIGIGDLLPLWGPIGTSGISSLYSRLFLRPRIAAIDPIFSNEESDRVFSTSQLISQHVRVLLIGLGLSKTDFQFIKDTFKVTDGFTLQNISVFYRIQLACKVFDIRVSDFMPFADTFGIWNAPLLIKPIALLKALTDWNGLKAQGWNLSQLYLSIKGIPIAITSPAARSATIAKATRELTDGLRSIRQQAEQNGQKAQESVVVDCERKFIMSRVASDFPRLNPDSLRYLLFQVASENSDSAIERLRQLLDPTMQTTVGDKDSIAYLVAPRTDSYHFSFQTDTSGEFSIGPFNYQFQSRIVDNKRETSPSFTLTGWECYYLNTPGDISQLCWETDQLPALPIDSKVLLPTGAVDMINEIYTAIARAANLIQCANLKGMEIAFLQANKATTMGCDFKNLNLSSISRVTAYGAFRDTLAGTTTLLDLFSWAISSHGKSSDGLSAKLQSLIATTTKWPPDVIANLFQVNYLGMDDSDVVQLFTDELEIIRLSKQVELITKLGLDGASMPLIFAGSQAEDFQGMSEATDDALVRLFGRPPISVEHSADKDANPFSDQLRANRRDALIQYLLQQRYIQSCNVRDADSLFEYFLIDVQMGACLRTSRIRQAISTVQLYIQRCLLNMEKGISSSAVNKDRWKWMQKYRVWEANRKIFLYPESWLDPVLRDNKTEVFKDLEASMMQAQLNKDSVLQLLKTYVYSVDEIGHLDIQAYFQEEFGTEKLQTKRYHLFARTRTSPFRYYYRRVEYHPWMTAPIPIWTGWETIQVDIPSYEVDERGNALDIPGSYLVPIVWKQQLYLFMPQAVLKTDTDPQAAPQTGKMFESKYEDVPKPKRYWELKMAWSIYRDGKWSTKQVSKDSAKIRPASQDAGFPNISSLRFPTYFATPDKSSNKSSTTSRQGIQIWVERCIITSTPDKILYTTHGYFTMRGSQMIFVSTPKPWVPSSEQFGWVTQSAPTQTNPTDNQPTNPDLPATLLTTFGKLTTATGKEEDFSASKFNAAWKTAAVKFTPSLAQIPMLGLDKTTDRSMCWTISYPSANGTPVGLATEIEIPLTDESYTWFSFPSSATAIAADLSKSSMLFSHVASPKLVGAATTAIDPIDITLILRSFSDTENASIFGNFNSKFYRETTLPYAIYNWELGFHSISLIGERLLSTQQFDLAIDVFRLIFDPTIPAPQSATDLSYCWQFPPFQDPETRAGGNIRKMLQNLSEGATGAADTQLAIAEWAARPFSPHGVARNRPLAYMKRIAMKYVEALIAAGDVYFRQNSLEAVPLAIQRYVEASHVFGPGPKRLPALTKPATKTFRDLGSHLDDFADAEVDFELLVPFYSSSASLTSSPQSGGGILGFLHTSYFGVPVNPDVAQLRSTIDDRLYKIRHCLDINGVPIRLSLWEPPLDPGLLARAAASGISPSAILDTLESPLPNFRFVYLLQRAFELCNELKQLGSMYLATREKYDYARLAILKNEQENIINSLVLDMKQLQKEEGVRALEQLQESRRGPTMRLQYYTAMTGDTARIPAEKEDFIEIEQHIEKPTADDLRMSKNEFLEMNKADESAAHGEAAANGETLASGLSLIPSVTIQSQPMGLGISVSPPAWATFSLLGAGILKTMAQISADEAARLARVGQLTQQLQERRLQANIAGREIKTIDKEIAVQQIRNAIVDKDIETQQKQLASSKAVTEYLKSQYTGPELYLWMDNTVQRLCYQTYLLALDLATKAERAYNFERGRDDISFIEPTGYWDSAKGGLLSGENLCLSLKRLEMAYMTKRDHDFEITKHISLRQLDAHALMNLRTESSAKFSLPEVLFDLDFPGHFNRRIKQVSVSVPCIVGPYISINSTLTLSHHQYRTSANIESYGADPPDKYVRSKDRVPISAVALSSAQNDAGVFELNFRDERYLPFEGAGVISEWTLALPPHPHQFDYSTISDVIVHLSYTASDGGADFSTKASTAAKKYLGSIANASKYAGLCCMLDLQSDFSSDWNRLIANTSSTTTFSTTLHNIQDRLPFFARGRSLHIENLSVFITPPRGSDENKATSLVLSGATLTDKDKSSQTQHFDLEEGGVIPFNIPSQDWEITIGIHDVTKLAQQRVLLIFRYTLVLE